jgi:hypothetical protein
MKNNLILSIITILLACNNNPKTENRITDKGITELSPEEKKHFVERGKEISQNTFKVLGGNLKKALGEGGVGNAINYCNTNASSLIDSLNIYHNASIRRTSNKTRNEANNPSKAELTIIDNYVNGGEMKPIVRLLDNGNTMFYAPIKTKGLCIVCHGIVGETISNEDYTIIKNHYPNDKAIGYNVDDFRGVWSIELKK